MKNGDFDEGSGPVPGQADKRTAAPGQEGKQSRSRGRRGQKNEEGEEDVYYLFKDQSPRDEDYGPNYGYQKLRFHKADEVNPYADAEDERLGLDLRLKKIIILVAVLVVVWFFAVTLPVSVFDVTVYPSGCTPAEFLDSFKTRLTGFLTFITGGESFYTLFVWEMIAAALAGAALGLSGGVYQGALNNALASPSTLGVTSGGTIGIIIYALFFYSDFEGTVDEYNQLTASMSIPELIVEYFGTFFCSLAGCFLIVAIIMLIALIAGRGHVSNISLVIAGQVLTSVIGVVISCIQYYLIYVAGNETLATLVENSTSVTFSGVYNATTVAVFAVPLLICMIYVFAMSGRLSLLAFSDDEARSMGINTNRTRVLMVAACTIMTALVISFTGPIGFVGFMVPHIARRLIGPEFRYLLPASALVGAILVVFTNYVTNLGIPGFVSGSTGTFTSIIGCVFFLVMALRTRGDNRADWY